MILAFFDESIKKNNVTSMVEMSFSSNGGVLRYKR